MRLEVGWRSRGLFLLGFGELTGTHHLDSVASARQIPCFSELVEHAVVADHKQHEAASTPFMFELDWPRRTGSYSENMVPKISSSHTLANASGSSLAGSYHLWSQLTMPRRS